MKHLLSALVFLSLLSQKTLGQIQTATAARSDSFEKGQSIGSYYPLDSITSVTLSNWKGDHILTRAKITVLAKALKKYSFNGYYAHTKPGHLECRIAFKNGTALSFYSNGSADVIIMLPNDVYSTFISTDKVNFDKF